MLFKTHWRDGNRLVGGGFYSGYARLKINEAWSLFGPDNGVASAAELAARISSYRKGTAAQDPDPEIGCVLPRNCSSRRRARSRPARRTSAG